MTAVEIAAEYCGERDPLDLELQILRHMEHHIIKTREALASELASLRSERDKLREALKPFAALADELDARGVFLIPELHQSCIRARAALSPTGTET